MPASASEDHAIAVARQRVISDDVMSLVGCRDVVEDEGDVWHVCFPTLNTEVLCGEPHVLVDKLSGTINEVYYTQ